MPQFLRSLAHYAAYLLAAGVSIVCLTALALRVWILPEIGTYKADIETAASRATGLKVTIASLGAEWHGLAPHLRLGNLRFTTADGSDALTLPGVDARLSWTSLLFADLRFASLQLERPHLVIQRDKAGIVHVAGVPVNRTDRHSPFPDWLLRQPNLSIHDGTLVWADHYLGAPLLTLDGVNIALRNRFGRHRFGLTTRPPAGIAQHLDLRGNFSGRSLQHLEDFKGQLYARADGISAQALHTWAPWAQTAVKSGHGNLQFWLDIDGKQATAMLGDVRLHDVRLKLADDLADFVFADLSGRIGWRKGKEGQEYYVQRLGFTSPRGIRAVPSDVRMFIRPAPTGKPALLRIETERLQLEALTALSGSVPIPRQAHDLIETLRPRGLVEHLSLDWQDRQHYRLTARVRDVGILPGSGLPGLSGVSGEVMASEKSGVAQLHAAAFRLDEARVFRNPLLFDQLEGKLDWETAADGQQRFRISGLHLRNADLEGNAQGTITLRPGASAITDITARLSHGRADAIWRYLPVKLSAPVHQWVAESLKAGVTPDTQLVLRGPMDRFPFEHGEGVFRVEINVRDGIIAAAHGWPDFTAVNGQVVFHDKGMDILASGEVMGATLRDVRGSIPDLHRNHTTTLIIEGQAVGRAQSFLDYIRKSPVNEHIDRFTEQMQAQGNGMLNLKLHMPLHNLADTQVSGLFQLRDTSLLPGRGLPVLERLNGSLTFTRQQVQARAVKATVFGQPAVLDIASAGGGRVKATLSGSADMQSLSDWLPTTLRPYFKGSLRYRAETSMQPGKTTLSVTSDLSGLDILLPQPLAKTATQAIPLRLDVGGIGNGERRLGIHYGSLLSAHGIYPEDASQARIGIRIGGGEATLPATPGLTLVAQQKRLDLDAWGRLAEQGRGQAGPPVREIALAASELQIGGRLLNDARLVARPADGGWALQVGSREVRGTAQWKNVGGLPSLQARLTHLALPLAEATGTSAKTPAQTLPDMHADISSDSLVWENKELGALQLQAEPAENGLRITRAALSNPDGQLKGDGLLSSHPMRESTFRLDLAASDLGKLFGRLGHPGYLKRGEAQASGTLTWQGGLSGLSLPTLKGNLQISLKKGQFPKFDPGAARLLGVLSLQSLPRRITLDFRDVFSEGFAFDEITTPVYLQNGTAYLGQLKMRGPAASIDMKGQVDLVHETQALRVSIEPRLEDTLAAGAMLINPALGVGALVASKVLQNPISKAATFEYLVTGSWEDPVVKRLPRAKSPNGDADAAP